MNAPGARVTVVGAGYVGLVTGVGLANLGHQIELVENRPDRLRALQAGRIPIHEAGLQEAFDRAVLSERITIAERPHGPAEVAMLCVGTPIGEDGESDLSQLHSAAISVAGLLGSQVPLVVRSTLPLGSTHQVVEWTGLPTTSVLTNPEFLRQGTALQDFLNPTRIVIGHFPGTSQETIDLVVGLFSGLPAPLLVVDVAAAELIKNGANAFLALRLSFTNEIATLAEEFGTDVDAVLRGISLDPRIGTSYMRPGLGFGGSCLPKELRAMAAAGSARGLALHVINAASDANAAQQRRFVDRVARATGGLEQRTVALLGLAFKAETDDTRESPALGVARELLARGARVQAYDPQAGPNAKREVPGLELAKTAVEALSGAEVAVIATEWPEFAQLDWNSIRAQMAAPVVFDGRRLLNPGTMRELGYRYEAVGTGHKPVTAEDTGKLPVSA
jgi:UDPglucose 6-dehydrogenase